MSLAEQLKSESSSAPLHTQPVPFGNYLLDELIAEGGMARVYRARLRGALGFEKPLVVKQVRPELASDPRFVAMFAEEAKTLVRLGHPHIVPVYELGVVDDVYFIAMEYIEGVPLAALLRRGPLDPPLVAHMAAQVAGALHHAHDRFDLVHRDVTPRNVLVDEEGHVRLVDFGIATPTGGGGDGEAFGSEGYMSPEQLAGQQLGPQSDLFSLGCVLYRALTGELPFRTEGDKLVRCEPGRALPEGLASVVASLLIEEADVRPSDASDIAREFRSWLSAESPAGVAQEFGQLVVKARKEQAKPHQQPAVPGSEPEARTLATSPLLREVLRSEPPAPMDDVEGSGTVRLERARKPLTADAHVVEDGTPDEADRSAANAPEETSAGWLRWLLVLAVVALAGAAAWYASTSDAENTETMRRGTPDVTPSSMNEAPDQGSEMSEQSSGNESANENGSDENGSDENGSDENGTENVSQDGTSMMQGSEVAPPDSEMQVARARPGELMVVAIPWANVSVDGQGLGQTPLRGVSIRPGSHTIVLTNPALGRSVTRRVQVAAGQRLRFRANLQVDPPTLVGP